MPWEEFTNDTRTYAFMWGEGTIESVELTQEKFEEVKAWTREEVERFAKGE